MPIIATQSRGALFPEGMSESVNQSVDDRKLEYSDWRNWERAGVGVGERACRGWVTQGHEGLVRAVRAGLGYERL